MRSNRYGRMNKYWPTCKRTCMQLMLPIRLRKNYMNQSLSDRRFDVVIRDEVSMAPLPAVYISASHADSSLVAIGDPHQLAPIVSAKTPIAERWLGTDLFDHRGISLKRAVE